MSDSTKRGADLPESAREESYAQLAQGFLGMALVVGHAWQTIAENLVPFVGKVSPYIEKAIPYIGALAKAFPRPKMKIT